MFKFFKFFVKKGYKEGLAKAQELGLISETEFLILKSKRAEEELQKHLTKKLKKKK